LKPLLADTNVLLRFIIGEPTEQVQQAASLFKDCGRRQSAIHDIILQKLGDVM
jgi:predicted nucleic acid-binding protein